MSWRDEIRVELDRAGEAQRTGNSGKVRTAARRAVGIAVTEYQKRVPGKQYGADFIRQVRGIATDDSLPIEVREAAARLQSRISQEFTSLSQKPLEDAMVIITFIERTLPS